MTAAPITGVVTRNTHGRVVDAVGGVHTVLVGLHYDPNRPYEVQLRVGQDTDCTWTFARDLLADGATELSGLGDVQVWPIGNLVAICLSNGRTTARLTIPAGIVERFLAATERRVRRGAERIDADVDALLVKLLGGTR